MNWRQVAFVIAGVIIIVIFAQIWVSTYVTPVQEVRAKNEPKNLPPPVIERAYVTVTDYTVEDVDPYHFDIHYVVSNPGSKAAKNIRIVVSPWKKVFTPDPPQDPDNENPKPLDPYSPLRSVSKTDLITELKPQQKENRRISFDRPNGTLDPLPPAVQYKETFLIEFEAP